MAKVGKNPPSMSPWDSEVRLLAWLATCIAVLSFLAYFQRGDATLYGDAIAHMNIARRVFDSKTPGLLQLGTVWLPLPHLLMVPFLISKEMWQRGAGGSIPSMIAYVFAVIGIFRLMRDVLVRADHKDPAARIAPWFAALVFVGNPNLIYMQTTAMGEALYLAFFVWTVVFLAEALKGERSALTKCGLCLAAACLTRYDGWFLAGVMAATVLALAIIGNRKGQSEFQFTRASAVKFLLIAAAAPLLWLVYNGIVYRNPLEFANGPYSAKAIEHRTQAAGNPGHPGSGNLKVASLYFLKAAQSNVAENAWLGRGWILLAMLAIAVAVIVARNKSSGIASQWLVLILLLVPIPFYALSIANGGVPIFVPAWWPFTHYNDRYGLQMLPAFAAACAILLYFALRTERWNQKLRMAVLLGLFAFVAVSYANVWRATPICLQEAQINMRTRNRLEAELATWLKRLPSDTTLLMYLGDHVGAVQKAGIPLKQVINEGNHRVWMQPSDPDGLWERALADPARYADYVLAFEGDPVWLAVHGLRLRALVEIHVSGQAPAVLYRVR